MNAIDIYTTDAKIGHLGLRVADDLSYFPRYDAAGLYRCMYEHNLRAMGGTRRLRRSINEAAMIAMNASRQTRRLAFSMIARDHLAGTAVAGAQRGLWAKLFGPTCCASPCGIFGSSPRRSAWRRS